MSPAVVRQRSREQQYAEARQFAIPAPRLNHADWTPLADRVDPIEILEASNKDGFQS